MASSIIGALRVNLGLDSAERSNGLKAARGQISTFAGPLDKVAAGLVAAAAPAMTAMHAGAARQDPAGSSGAAEAARSGTRPGRRPDIQSDTPGGVGTAKILREMEAGTGIEPVFTDLQSRNNVIEFNALDVKKVSDKPGTQDERDTRKNAVQTCEAEYLRRAERARPLQNWSSDRWGWKRAIRRDAFLSDAAKLLAATLCDDFAHHETAACNPSVETLAEALAKSERSIQRALAELKDGHWIAVAAVQGRGRKNEIRFLNGDGTVALTPSQKVTALSPKAPEKVTTVTLKGDKRVTPYNKDKPNKNQRACASREAEDPRQPHQRKVVHFGSHNLTAWNAWLAERGFKFAVEQLAPKASDRDGVGYDMPGRMPPAKYDKIGEVIADRYFGFLLGKLTEA